MIFNRFRKKLRSFNLKDAQAAVMGVRDREWCLQLLEVLPQLNATEANTLDLLCTSRSYEHFRAAVIIQAAGRSDHAQQILSRWRDFVVATENARHSESNVMESQSIGQPPVPPRGSQELSTAERTWQYSDAFEEEIAEYITGNRKDRSEKVITELYTKLFWLQSFFAKAEEFVNLMGKRFIEVGCGTGVVSVTAASRGGIVTSTDYVDKCVGFTKRRMAEHGFATTAFQSDLRSPISRELRQAFDFVWCFQVLEHISRAEQFTALGNLFSLVAPGGFLFIDTENSLCPYDRHDTNTWLLRLASKESYLPIILALGKGVNFLEPSTGERVQVRDYLSYDEIIGAASVSGFKMINPFMPHLTKKKYLYSTTGSDWLHDSILKNFDVERFAPVSLLLQRS